MTASWRADVATERRRLAVSALSTRLRCPRSWRVTSRDSISRTLEEAPQARRKARTVSVDFQVTTPRPRRWRQAPGKPLPPIVHEFLKYIYSREGQSDVVKDGYFPVDGATIEKHLASLR